MNDDLSTFQSLGDEARGALAERAAASARANTPRYLLVGAGGLMLVGLALLIGAVFLRTGALARLEQQRAEATEIRKSVGQLLAFRAAEEQERKTGLYDEDLVKSQKIIEHGTSLGIEGLTGSQSPDTRTATGAFRRKFETIRLDSPVSPDLLAQWIALVQDRELGVELSRVELNPAKSTYEGVPRWTGTVVFSRWERKP
jgi:hypothetical protein